MFGLGKKKPNTNQVDVAEMTAVLPVDLNQAHSYVAPDPVHNDYPVKVPFGSNPYSDQIGKDLPTIKNQDAILVHYFQPPASMPPQAWYDDRNEQKIKLSRQELTKADPWQALPDNKDAVTDNPWLHTQPSNRRTSTQSPSDYRFIRPFDQRWNRNLNGLNGSMASIGKAYAVGGMGHAPDWRNTLRMEPTRWDIEQFDMSANQVPAAQPGVYVSPSAEIPSTSQYWGIR